LTEGPTLDPATMFEDVYKEMPPHLVRQRQQLLDLTHRQPPPEAHEQDDPDRRPRPVAKEG
jgi:hypothetical protein